MAVLRKVKSCPKSVVDCESNLESVKSNKRLYSKKYQTENHTNNQQKWIDCLNQDQIKMSMSVKNVVAITFL